MLWIISPPPIHNESYSTGCPRNSISRMVWFTSNEMLQDKVHDNAVSIHPPVLCQQIKNFFVASVIWENVFQRKLMHNKKVLWEWETGTWDFRLVKSLGISRRMVNRTINRLVETDSVNDKPWSGLDQCKTTPQFAVTQIEDGEEWDALPMKTVHAAVDG